MVGDPVPSLGSTCGLCTGAPAALPAVEAPSAGREAGSSGATAAGAAATLASVADTLEAAATGLFSVVTTLLPCGLLTWGLLGVLLLGLGPVELPRQPRGLMREGSGSQKELLCRRGLQVALSCCSASSAAASAAVVVLRRGLLPRAGLAFSAAATSAAVVVLRRGLAPRWRPGLELPGLLRSTPDAAAPACGAAARPGELSTGLPRPPVLPPLLLLLGERAWSGLRSRPNAAPGNDAFAPFLLKLLLLPEPRVSGGCCSSCRSSAKMLMGLPSVAAGVGGLLESLSSHWTSFSRARSGLCSTRAHAALPGRGPCCCCCCCWMVY